jgi:hypothetical protein
MNDMAVPAIHEAARTGDRAVRHFRQVLLWPLQLVATRGQDAHARHWESLGSDSRWSEVIDEYTGDPKHFGERHYNEFVSFLPYVQRFLYGEGRSQRGGAGIGSPMRVFRRSDIVAVRVVISAGAVPITLQIKHIDLYFFYDLDVALLNVEVSADDLTLTQAEEVMYRFGRAYPASWSPSGEPQHCLQQLEWLGAEGQVLAASDAQRRELFLAHVAQHRAPRIATHWAYVLEPLVAEHSERDGALRFRQIEYHRMPMMAYLAMDAPRSLDRADFIRLGLVTGASQREATLPFADSHVADFEQRFCYDRFWADAGAAPNTRYLCNGYSLVVIGDAGSEFYRCAERGVLAQFRHQHFLLFLIAHSQKAALLMFSDGLSRAMRDLDLRSPESIKRFKRSIRIAFEGFLRFTHRYWFHEISDQAQVHALFQLCASHLGLDPLYGEVKDRIADMSSYLDADSLRRQANTVVRLTVVTMFGLIGTVTTGFLGMNLIAAAEEPLVLRIAGFLIVLVLTTALTFYTIIKSRRLSDFLDALSDERFSMWTKMKAIGAVWRRTRGG